MNPLRRASAPYSDGTILACRLAHGDSCPPFNNSDVELTNMQKTISRKANLSLPPSSAWCWIAHSFFCPTVCDIATVEQSRARPYCERIRVAKSKTISKISYLTNLSTHTPLFIVCGAPPLVPEGEQNNKWLEKMLTLKRLYVHWLTATDVPWCPIGLLLVAADGVSRAG